MDPHSSADCLRDFFNTPREARLSRHRRYPPRWRRRHSDIVAVSSCSAGGPVLWRRGLCHELDIAYRLEHIFRDAFEADRHTTLAFVMESELANHVPADRRTPVVSLHPAGDPDHSPPGVKHRYTRRSAA